MFYFHTSAGVETVVAEYQEKGIVYFWSHQGKELSEIWQNKIKAYPNEISSSAL